MDPPLSSDRHQLAFFELATQFCTSTLTYSKDQLMIPITVGIYFLKYCVKLYAMVLGKNEEPIPPSRLWYGGKIRLEFHIAHAHHSSQFPAQA